MRTPLLLALALVACGPPTATSDAAAGLALRVATWNVHDLFDEVDRTAPPGDEDTVLTPAEVEAKLARVGAVLARLDADVVILQEVENLGLLERLVAGALSGGGYRAFLQDGFDPRGIDVGVLARVPVASVVSHLDDRAPEGGHLWSRDLVEVHLPVGARELVLLGNHLVSRLDPAEDMRRQLQAMRVRQVTEQLRAGPTSPTVLVLGDLNDVAGSPALAPLLGDGGLVDLGAGLPPAEAWTWSGAGARERIDYALVPASDRRRVTRVAVAGGDDVAAASDHRPLVIDLWMGDRG